jgi:hypothetical protein
MGFSCIRQEAMYDNLLLTANIMGTSKNFSFLEVYFNVGVNPVSIYKGNEEN